MNSKLLLVLALLLGGCGDGSRAESGKDASGSVPQSSGCPNRVATDAGRDVSRVHLIRDKAGSVIEFAFYVADPQLEPAIKGNPGTRYHGHRITDHAANLVRSNLRDQTNPLEYVGMTSEDRARWSRVIFRDQPVTFDAERGFGVTKEDEFPTRELLFLEDGWAVTTIVPDPKVALASEFREQAISSIPALFGPSGCARQSAVTSAEASAIGPKRR